MQIIGVFHIYWFAMDHFGELFCTAFGVSLGHSATYDFRAQREHCKGRFFGLFYLSQYAYIDTYRDLGDLFSSELVYVTYF
jgi:hypothetical protein